jgi:MFS family permease
MSVPRPATPATAASPKNRKGLFKAFTASLVGTSLEYYDFAVYSVAAAVVFPQVFFPHEEPLTGTLLAFSTYAVGFIARPVGGFIFGRLGDILGRKRILVITLLLIGASTVAIGLLPGYDTIGVAAPLLLVTLRFAQGVAVGGEWGGAVLLSSEYGNPRQRGFWASASQVGSPAGTLLANLALVILALMFSDEDFVNWGWRIAFVASAILVGFGLWIRLRLEDTPIFKAMEAAGDRPTAPIRELIRTQKRPLLAGMLVRIAPDIFYALFLIFVITYGTQRLDFTKDDILVAVLIGCAFQLGLIPLAGWVSDKINRRLVYAAATIGGLIWAVAFFLLLGTNSMAMLIIAVCGGLVFHAFTYGPQAAFITEQFPVHLRSTGSALAYTLAALLGGAWAPLIFTALLSNFDGWLPMVAYVAVAVALTLVGLKLGRDPDPSEDEHYARIAEQEGLAGTEVAQASSER